MKKVEPITTAIDSLRTFHNMTFEGSDDRDEAIGMILAGLEYNAAVVFLEALKPHISAQDLQRLYDLITQTLENREKSYEQELNIKFPDVSRKS